MDQGEDVLGNVGILHPDWSAYTVAQYIECCPQRFGSGLMETYAENLAHGLSPGSGLFGSID